MNLSDLNARFKWTQDSRFWFTRLREGELHMMVWRKGMGWIDNAHPLWGPRQLPRLFPMPWPGVILKLMMGLVR